MKNLKHIVVLACFLMVGSSELFAQAPARKFSVTGAARGYFFGDRLSMNETDTVTIPRLNSGHTLADLGLNVRPNKWMEIQGMVRVRNDYGGFWGSGVTFDIRQMYIKGVIGGIVRYQLGDINYRLTPYTMWNNDQELFTDAPMVFRRQWDMVNYDHFYDQSNSWRQQGGAAEFGLVFKKWINEIQFKTVATRVRASNNSSVNDRVFAGYTVELIQSKYIKLGWNSVGLYDISGTSTNQSLYKNPVNTGTVDIQWKNDQWNVTGHGEMGRSTTTYTNNIEAPEWSGQFREGTIRVKSEKMGWYAGITGKRVSAQFNSPGAQTKRINFNQLPTAYDRFTNAQIQRDPVAMDLMRESSMYTLQLSPYLMAFSPKYDNITPYGAATPNRQGWIAEAGWESKYGVKVKVQQWGMKEVQGEGTSTPREYTRTIVGVHYATDTVASFWKKRVEVEAVYRADQTTRSGSDAYRGVDLSTTVLGLGASFEVLNQLDIIGGIQNITYSGFDFAASRNVYGEIFNFREYAVDGSELMKAMGLRYRFSEKSQLTAQVNWIDINDNKEATPEYGVRQLMILYNMNF